METVFISSLSIFTPQAIILLQSGKIALLIQGFLNTSGMVLMALLVQ